MAVGIIPKFSVDYEYKELSKSEFLVLAIESLKANECRIYYISEGGIIAETTNLFTRNFTIKIKLDEDKATFISRSQRIEFYDFETNSINIDCLIESLEKIKPSFTPGMFTEKFNELYTKRKMSKDDQLHAPPSQIAEKFKNFFSIFISRKGFAITPIIINLNLLIFIIMAISGVNLFQPDTTDLLNWGANFRAYTLNGEWWRLFSSCFLHIGILHLLMNMYALLYIGILLEPLLGKARFTAAYLLTGLASSVTSLALHDASVSAGASGAIFGMYGVFLALLTTDLIEKSLRKELQASMFMFVAFNLLYGLKAGIDNAAHIGGLISGFIIGYAFIFSLKKPENIKLKFATIIAALLVVVTSSYGVMTNISSDIGSYLKKIELFSEQETKALEAFRMSSDTPVERQLEIIDNVGIDNWNKNIELLQEFERLNLSDNLKARNAKLMKYCQLRLKTFYLFKKILIEQTDSYNAEIKECNQEIEKLLKELNEK